MLNVALTSVHTERQAVVYVDNNISSACKQEVFM